MKSRKSLAHLAILVIVSINLVSMGCAGKQVVPGSTTSQAALAYKAVDTAYMAYDLAMSSLRMLQVNKIITLTQYNSIKDRVGWPVYHALVAAQAAAELYAKTPSDTALEKVKLALEAVAVAQAGFTKVVQGVQK